EVEPQEPAADLAAQRSRGRDDVGLAAEVAGRVLDTGAAQVQPGQVRALRLVVPDAGQVLGDEVGEQPSVAVEVGDDVVEPGGAVTVRRGRRQRPDRRRLVLDDVTPAPPRLARGVVAQHDLRALETGQV